MAKVKSRLKKKRLGHELQKNKRPPVWAFLKKRDRGLLRERRRNWRFQKLTRKMKRKVKKSGS